MNSNKMSDILKTRGKLKTIGDIIVNEFVTYTMTKRIMNFVQ